MPKSESKQTTAIIYEVFGTAFISPTTDFEDIGGGDKSLKKEIYNTVIEPTIIKEAIKSYILDDIENACGVPFFFG